MAAGGAAPEEAAPEEAAPGEAAAEKAAAAAAEPAAAAAPKRRRMDNFTLINLVLRVCGPMHERTLTNALLALQVVSCGAGLALRYWLSRISQDEDASPAAAAASAASAR